MSLLIHCLPLCGPKFGVIQCQQQRNKPMSDITLQKKLRIHRSDTVPMTQKKENLCCTLKSFFCSSPSWSLSHWQYCLGLHALELLLSVDRCCLNFHKLAQVLQLRHYRFSSLNMCPSGPNSFPQSQNQELRKQRLAQPHRIPRSPGIMSDNIR